MKMVFIPDIFQLEGMKLPKNDDHCKNANFSQYNTAFVVKFST